jgi:Xaa-Pro aminopeptidase
MPAAETNAYPVLLYASTDRSADALYFGGVEVPDAFIAFGYGSERVAVLSRLEIARVRREGCFDTCLSLEEWQEAVKKKGGKGTTAEVIALIAREWGIEGFEIGYDFPAGLANQLAGAGVALQVVEGPLFPGREFKADIEAEAIREGNAASAAGFRVVEKTLRKAEIGRGRKLYFEGKVLTSERLRHLIDVACLERGAVASGTIVAGGDQACDPHCRGSGPLRADELIIVDIFPRVSKTGYHGDMTRTYLKGRASEAQRALYATVFEAQQEALSQFRAGRSGLKIYRSVCAHFEAKGYRTEVIKGTPVGFFHGLGHGLGLEVHEGPRVSAVKSRLKKGQVITVEPGLYYPGLGGVRIEDVVRVTSGEPELLSAHPYRWHIR